MQVTQVQDQITHAVVSSGKVQSFGIAQTAEFFQVLSSSLYSDKPLAVIRETLCNGWDAHIEAGCTDTPLKITLTDKKLIIRDFGLGIHPDQILPLYGTYGGTSKVANDQVTGGFGLGCKAPFAYVDHFEVTSHHQGMKTVYRMSLSSAVVGGLPTITEIVSVPTTEQGVSVEIDLKDFDRKAFATIIRRITALGDMKVELNGQLLERLPFSDAKDGYLILNNEDQIFGESQSSNQIFIRYGNVVYPIAENSEYRNKYRSVLKFLSEIFNRQRYSYGFDYMSFRIILQAEPNSISVTPSRESLSMTDHTIATVKRLLTDVLKKLNWQEIQKLIEYFAEEAINQTFLLDTPKVLFNFGSIPNIDHLPGNGPKYLYNYPTIAEHLIRQVYPNHDDFTRRDMIMRLKVLVEAGFGRTNVVKSFLNHVIKVKATPIPRTRKHRIVKAQTSWWHKHYLWPIIKGMPDAGLDFKKLHVWGMQRNEQFFLTSSIGLTQATQWGTSDLKMMMPFLRDIVIIGFNRTQIEERVGSFPVIKHWLGDPDKGALFYRVSRTSKNLQTVRDYFTKLGMTVIDLTIAQPWEPKTATAPIPKPVSTIKRVPGIPMLSEGMEGTLGARFSNDRVWSDGIPRIENPEFIVVQGPRQDDLCTLGRFGSTATAAIVRLWGKVGGICRSNDQADKYRKLGAKELQNYVQEKLLEEIKTNSKLTEAFAQSLEHRNFVVDSDRQFIFDAMFNDPELRKKFKIPSPPEQREKDLMAIYNSYEHWDFRKDPLKSIQDLVKAIDLHPKIADLAKKTNDSDLIRIFSASQLHILFSGSPNPQRLEQRKKVRAMLLSVLKG